MVWEVLVSNYILYYIFCKLCYIIFSNKNAQRTFPKRLIIILFNCVYSIYFLFNLTALIYQSRNSLRLQNLRQIPLDPGCHIRFIHGIDMDMFYAVGQ